MDLDHEKVFLLYISFALYNGSHFIPVFVVSGIFIHSIHFNVGL